jgi:transposase
VVRVLKRFITGGVEAVPRRSAPGRERTVTEARARRTAARDRVGSRTPVGQDTANWTTERLAEYLCEQTGIQVSEETVRVYLHAHDYVCKRPTWTDASARPKHKPIMWETRQGRGSFSRCYRTRPSTLS